MAASVTTGRSSHIHRSPSAQERQPERPRCRQRNGTTRGAVPPAVSAGECTPFVHPLHLSRTMSASCTLTPPGARAHVRHQSDGLRAVGGGGCPVSTSASGSNRAVSISTRRGPRPHGSGSHARRRRVGLAAALSTLAAADPAAAQFTIGGDPRVNPDDFRNRLRLRIELPKGLARLSNGSILVATHPNGSGTFRLFRSALRFTTPTATASQQARAGDVFRSAWRLGGPQGRAPPS